MMQMTEIEAKFLIKRPEQFDRLLEELGKLGYEVSERATETYVDHYFDAADWAILRSGWAYRCRECRGQQTLNLKSLGSKEGAVFIRDEIEQPVTERPSPDTGDIPAGPVQEHLTQVLGDTPVRKLFQVQSNRTVFVITPPDDGKNYIELDLDRTRIDATKVDEDAPGRLDFTELEFEVEPDSAEELESLLQKLGDRFGLIPAKLGKFDRGIQAAGLSTVAEEDSEREPWPGEQDPVPNLVHRYTLHQVHRMTLYEPRAFEGLEPEGVHKMRVAVRRTRSVLRAFRNMVPEDVWDQLNDEQRWLARRLGRARDADIFSAAISRHEEVLDGAATIDVEPFITHIRTTRDNAYAALRDALASDRYRALIESLESFAVHGPNDSVRQRCGELRIADYANEVVHRALSEVVSQGRSIADDSTARQLHKLRIAAKRLRYLLDCFTRTGLTQWLGLIEATHELQDLLGEHQDAVMVRERLTTYAKSSDPAMNAPELHQVIGKLIEKEDDRAMACRQNFPACWSRFEDSIG